MCTYVHVHFVIVFFPSLRCWAFPEKVLQCRGLVRTLLWPRQVAPTEIFIILHIILRLIQCLVKYKTVSVLKLYSSDRNHKRS